MMKLESTETVRLFPGSIIMCRATNNGNGARIQLIRAQAVRNDGRYCHQCVANAVCAELHNSQNTPAKH